MISERSAGGWGGAGGRGGGGSDSRVAVCSGCEGIMAGVSVALEWRDLREPHGQVEPLIPGRALTTVDLTRVIMVSLTIVFGVLFILMLSFVLINS